VLICSKTGEAVASDFRTILARNGGRRPLALGGDKGKKCVNSRFRKLLDDEGIEIRVYKNPDVKCAIVESFNRTLKFKLYKWFTRNNT